MVYKIFSVMVCGAVAMCFSLDSNAQRKTTRRAPQTTNKVDTAAAKNDYFGNNTQAATDTSAKPKPGGGLNVPLQFVASKGNVFTDTIAPSLRNEDAFDRNLVKERTPLEYQNIREDDAVYMEKVWRVIDTREKINLPFRNPTEEDGASELFLAILYKAVTDSSGGTSVTAFKDERFSQPYGLAEFKTKFSGGLDTVNVLDLQGNITGKQVRPREFKVDSVYQYEIKEEWIFDKETSRMYVRIIGIAPMMRYPHPSLSFL